MDLSTPWLVGVGIGALIAAVVGGLFLRSKPSADGRSFAIRVGKLWPGALMLGAASVAGWVGLMGWPRWPAVSGEDRLGWVYLLVTLLAVFAGLLQRSFAVRAGLAAVGAATGAALTLYTPSAGVGALAGNIVTIALSAAGMLVGAGALSVLEWRGRRAGAAFILTGLALAAGAALALSSSARLGFFAWSIVPACAIATAISSLRKGAALGSAAYVCGACVLGATLIAGFSYSDLKPASAAILALCPVLALIADAVLTPMLKPKMAAVAVILCAAVPAGVAVMLSYR